MAEQADNRPNLTVEQELRAQILEHWPKKTGELAAAISGVKDPRLAELVTKLVTAQPAP